jgi:LPXTG-motif cell wall-anchored protein
MLDPIACPQPIRYEPPTRTDVYVVCGSGLPKYEMEKDLMRRVVYIAALAIMAMLVLAPGAMAQQMNHQHMMPNGQMMDDDMMASPSASASASPSASAYPSATASTSASASPSATTTASAPRSHHHGGGGSSASAAAGGRLPSTGGVSLVALVSVGAVALLVGFGLVGARLLRRNH